MALARAAHQSDRIGLTAAHSAAVTKPGDEGRCQWREADRDQSSWVSSIPRPCLRRLAN